MSNQLAYDARQASGQSAQKAIQRAMIMMYEGLKWLVNFIGDMIKILLAK